MAIPPAYFPDLESLSAGLASALTADGFGNGRLTVLAREPNVYSSTFSSEIVTCRLGNERPLRLLCKYGPTRYRSGRGQRGGVAYEAAAYRHVLRSLHVSAPRLYGVHNDTATEHTWLVIEYLEGCQRVGRIPSAMGLAARWIGEFHAANETRVSQSRLPSLITYDAEYYLGWARRTSEFAGPLHERFPWLAGVCKRFEEVIPTLLALPLTIIHGEYYPRNVLVHDGAAYPVDWESAAIAAGEIDLATLAEGWPADIIEECHLEYRRARWPHGSPEKFDRALAGSQLYTAFRWLGDQPEQTHQANRLYLFDQLRTAGEQLGLT